MSMLNTSPSDISLADATSAAGAWAAVLHPPDSELRFDLCVDWLLDRFHATTDTTLKALISDVLADLRGLGPIDESMIDLAVDALASVDAAFAVVAAR